MHTLFIVLLTNAKAIANYDSFFLVTPHYDHKQRFGTMLATSLIILV